MTHRSADRASNSGPEPAAHLPNTTGNRILLVFSLMAFVLFAGVPAWSATAQTITLTLTPASATLVSGGVQQFTATVQGTANTGVTWSTSAGKITSSGLFTAPAVTTTTGVTVTVRSAANTSKSASATVAVVSQSSPGITKVSVQGNAAGSSGEGTPMPPTQQGSNFDGPAELPRVYVDSAMSDTPSPGKTWSVAKGGSLQQALNNAACGDTIELEAGAKYSDNVTVPAKNCDNAHWITVRTSAADSALPPEGTRITPCYAGVASLPGRPSYNCTKPTNVMAQVVNPKSGAGPIVFAPGANYYRFLGLEVTRTANGQIVYALISMTPGFTADHLVFDRMWVHGTAQDETQKGIHFGGSTNLAVVDSYLTDMHCISRTGVCTDGVAIGGGNGDNPMGPYKIVDNFLEASGENILFGGGAASVTPADIEVRNNHMFKPLTWMKGQPGYVGGRNGNPFIVKNLFELKNAQRVLLEGNVMENSWGGFSQTGFGMLLTPKNQSTKSGKTCPICQTTDITVRYSVINHVASGLQIGNGLSSEGLAALDGERYSIHDIVIDGINGNKFNGFGLFAQVSMGQGDSPTLQNVTIQHVTAFPDQVLLNIGDKTTRLMVNFQFLNNMVSATPRPITSTGGTGNCANNAKLIGILNNCFNPYQFASNALIATPSNDPPSEWPTENYFPSGAQGLFVNYNNGDGGDYHLVSNSPYKNAGTDGKDLGADIDMVDSYTANSR